MKNYRTSGPGEEEEETATSPNTGTAPTEPAAAEGAE